MRQLLPSPLRATPTRLVAVAVLLATAAGIAGCGAGQPASDAAGGGSSSASLGAAARSVEPEAAESTPPHPVVEQPDPAGTQPPGPELPADDGESEPEPPVTPAHEKCFPYDPAALEVEKFLDHGWRVRAGNYVLAVADTSTDANDFLAVARRWRSQCFIGWFNTRWNKDHYITRYFKNPSELPLGMAPSQFDCISYDPSKLTIEAIGPLGYQLKYSHGGTLVTLDNEQDAARAMLVASAYTQLCFIGRSNQRSPYEKYLFEYWRQ